MLSFHEFRNNNQKKIIVFIHGFTGHAEETWKDFAEFMKLLPEFLEFDIASIGYPSSKTTDIWFWKSDPCLSTISEFAKQIIQAKLPKYHEIHFIAHSMGGLVLQRLVLDVFNKKDLSDRIKSVIMFGTPSAGLKKAIIGRIFKKQIADMHPESKFIRDLRDSWGNVFSERTPFTFASIAGMEDDFVPRESSLSCFGHDFHRLTDGDHLGIVKPIPASRMSIDLIIQLLSVRQNKLVSSHLGLSSSEFIYYHKTISNYQNIQDLLTDSEIVKLALAFDAIGDGNKSREVLEKRLEQTRDTDLKGTLAGRYKREWLKFNNHNTAEKALGLYSEAYGIALKRNDYEQAYYNGINVAFMTLIYVKDEAKTASIAERIIDITSKAPATKWAEATKAEAYLYMGDNKNAIHHYKRSLQMNFSIRETISMYTQAINICKHRLGENSEMELEIDSLFLE